MSECGLTTLRNSICAGKEMIQFYMCRKKASKEAIFVQNCSKLGEISMGKYSSEFKIGP